MSYLKYLDDEQLKVFGFVVDPNDPTKARHTTYPLLSVRYRCPFCKMWASAKGGKVMVCDQCHKGAKPVRPTKQFKKLYECCGNVTCETWRQVLALFRDFGLPIESCHDRYRGYIQVNLSPSWPQDKRDYFHELVNNFSVSKFGARQVQCNKSGTTGSKLPKSQAELRKS